MAPIAYEKVSKVYDDGTTAVHDLDLAIEDGELMVVVGPSGCGKTTALRMLAGLEEISAGEIRIGDRVVNDLTPKERDIAMVFQSYALYPHMTVEQNLAFGLKLRKLPKPEVQKRVQEAAEILEIDDFLKRKPRALSGGQRQRVAMGRAIVREPQAFLMDEPLSNLDAKLRVQMRAEIHQLQRRLGVTTLYVTHDQVEAMTMGDRVAVMRDGHLQQVDTPQALYESPVNEFVAGFIGSPAINLVEAQLERDEGGVWVSFGGHRLLVDEQLVRNKSILADYVGRRVVLGIRPEDFEDASLERDVPQERRLTTHCDLTEPLGAEVLVYFTVSAAGLAAVAAESPEDAEVLLGVKENGEGPRSRLVARVSPRTRIAEDSEIQLVVDTRRLYFFDPETEAAI
ncbi:MAG: sn-glycerol-3-phosphate ABC transporter ATP-binding protein UgpC [Actinobacteria bacterium]|nr:MAG: sn-glycerol-3-phosphate ABC transporter ATP-binding protein UgpC [Actinomycetota bacterium]